MLKSFSRHHLGERSFRFANSGIAAIEFAFIVPVFLILFMGAVDMGQMLYDYYQLDQAVAAGAEYAVVNASEVNSTSGATLANSIATLIESENGSAWANDTVVVNDGPSATATSGTITTGGTASNANSCYCPTGSPPNWTWGSASTCSSACSGSGQSGKFVTVTASYAYKPIVTIYSFLNNTTLTQSAAVQTQ